MIALNSSLDILGPEVMEVRAMRATIEEQHLNWFVSFAPERDEDNIGRVVYGTIHAAGESGVGEVTVACMMGISAEDDPGVEGFGDLLAQSRALETLWDVARMALRSAMSPTEIEVSLPAKAPDPEMGQLVRSDQDSTDDAVEQSSDE